MHRLLKMRPDEFRSFVPLFVLNLLMTSGFFVARTAKDALFYSHAGANRLPVAFIINAIIIFVIGGWIAGAQERLPLRRMMHVSWLVTILLALGFGIAFGLGLTSRLGLSPYYAFFAFFEIPYLTLTGLFWAFADGYFTERQADDIYPKITSGAHLGTTIAGLVAIFATPLIGSAGLIWVWSGLLVASFGVLSATWRRRKPQYVSEPAVQGKEGADSEGDLKDAGVGSGFRAILRHRYATLFMAITFCTFFIMSIFDYSLADTSKAIIGNDADKLTVYLGYITTSFGFIAFFVQLLVVPRLMRKLGVADTNLIAPSLLTGGGVVLLTTYTFGAAAIARGLFLVNEFVFNQTLLPFIYAAVPAKDRNQVRSTTEGTVTNVALGVAGLFLLLPAAVKGFQVHWLGMVAFFAALLMLGLSLTLRREYNSIRGTRFEASDPTGRMRYLDALQKLGDTELDTQLRRDLASESEPNILLALNFVTEHKRKELFEQVLALVNDISQDIRLAAIRTTRSLVETDQEFECFAGSVRLPRAPDVRSRFKREDLPTLREIADVYIEAGRTTELGDDFAYLLEADDSEPSVQGMVASHLIKKSGSKRAIEMGLDFLDKMLNSDNHTMNAVAVGIVGEMGYDSANFQKLTEWIRIEEALALQTAALEAITKVGEGSRAVAEMALKVVLETTTCLVLCSAAVVSASRIIAAHPFLLSAFDAYWRSKNTGQLPLNEAMVGALPRLPWVLVDVTAPEADQLLLAIAEGSEHQIASQALRVVGIRRRAQSGSFVVQHTENSA